MRRLFLMNLVFLLMLSFVFSSFGQEISILGKVGYFKYTADDPDFRDYWSQGCLLVGGRLSYHVSQKSVLSLDIEQTRSENDPFLYSDLYIVQSHAQTLSGFVLYTQRLLDKGNVIPYITSGFGICQLSGTISVDNYTTKRSNSDFIYKVLFGLELNRVVVLEVGYMDGDRPGNTGLIFSGGLMGYIAK